MTITRFARDVEPLRPRLNSNTVAVIDDVTAFAALLPLLDELRTEHAPARLLVTIDDPAQAFYTSMHAGEADGLDPGTPDDLDRDDPVAVAGHDDAVVAHVAHHLDTATPPERADYLEQRASGEDDVRALALLNARPDDALDEQVLVQRCPVDRDDLAIAGLPNGYVASDWDVVHNHALVRRLEEHGYRHFGVGASLLAFDRPIPPDADEAIAVVRELLPLYGHVDSEHWDALRAALTGSTILLLGYTEGFADLLLG